MLKFDLTLIAIRFGLLLSLLLFELHGPMMHHSTCQLVDADLLISIEAQNVNGSLFLHRPNKSYGLLEYFILCHAVFSSSWCFSDVCLLRNFA